MSDTAEPEQLSSVRQKRLIPGKEKKVEDRGQVPKGLKAPQAPNTTTL